MSSVVISGDSSGTVSLTVPSVAGTNTATLPAATGTVMVSGNMPAFSATNNANQSFSTGTFTKILFQTETFDTNNNFASSTFTPTVAGYYAIIASLNQDFAGSNGTYASTAIYKNGSLYQLSSYRSATAGTGLYGGQQATALVYCNGSTDYIEIYAQTNNITPIIAQTNSGGSTIFSGYLVRNA
jgi:hypothetical protein